MPARGCLRARTHICEASFIPNDVRRAAHHDAAVGALLPHLWQHHLSHLTAASPIAKVILSQGACALQAERNWKIYGCNGIMTPERSAMSHEKADKRVFLYNMLCSRSAVRRPPTFCRLSSIGMTPPQRRQRGGR